MSGLLYAALVLYVLGAIAGVAMAAHVVHARPGIGLTAIGAFIVSASTFPIVPPMFGVAGISVYPEDVLALVLLLATLPRLEAVKLGLPGGVAPWLIVTAFFVFSLVRGVVTLGPGVSFNGARATAFLVIATAWALAQIQDTEFFSRFDRFVLMVGWILVAIALFHIATRGFGSADAQIQQGDLLVTNRPLVAGQAMVLALAGIYQLRRVGQAPSAAAFLLVAAASQHRSVWVAMATGLMALVIVARSSVRAQTLWVVGASAVSALTAAAFGLLGQLPERLVHSATSLGTFEGRSAAWGSLVSEHHDRGPFAILLGRPFGTGWARINADGLLETFAPHSWYIQLYLRIGLVAVTLLVLLILYALGQATKRRRYSAALLTSLAVFAAAYHLPWYLAPMLALALCSRLPDEDDGSTALDVPGHEVGGRRGVVVT